MKIKKLLEFAREIDPYGEEDWPEDFDIVKYTEKQIEFLTYTENRLARFVQEYNGLTNLWMHDNDYNIDLNELLGDNSYPFDKSFEELEIEKWYLEFIKKIEGTGIIPRGINNNPAF